jgi:HK97 family phage major capsid protein
MRQAKAAKIAEARALLAKVQGENRGFTAEEDTKVQALTAEARGFDSMIAAEESVAAEEAELRKIPAPRAAASGVEVGRERSLDKPFRSFGEQLQMIVAAAAPRGTTFGEYRGGEVDRRLLEVRDPSGGAGSIPSDGGFLIHPEYSDQIFQRAYETGVLASRCDPVEIGEGSDSLEVPYVDETSRVTGSRWGGVQVYRANEADAVNATRPKIGKMETRLEDLKGLAYATDRLLRDAPAMSKIYGDAFSSEFGYKLDDEIFQGTGAGQCLGITKAPCLVTVGKETGQGAKTIMWDNIVNMRSRLWAKSRAKMVWFYNQDIEPQLHKMSLAVGTGGLPVFMPANGASGLPYDTLYGAPLIPIEQAATLGTVGDIVLADLSQYVLVRKDGLQGASSMHVRFIYDEMTFRWTMRVNGQPKWKTALTPASGSANTLSPFVALATRS